MDPKHEIPSLNAILVSMDTADRDKDVDLSNTIDALVKRALLDGVNPEHYLKLSILVAFKRRNHLKSQAPGDGEGEKYFLRAVLHCVAAISPDLVQRVVPLVPLYGSWRDLRLLGEEMYSMASDASADEKGYAKAVAKSVAQTFARQLKKDLITAKIQVPGLDIIGGGGGGGADENEVKALAAHISNASKYAPSCSRNRGSKQTRKLNHRYGTAPVNRNPSRRKLTAEELDASAVIRKRHHEGEEWLTDEVARCLGLRATHLRADLRKLVVSPLNAVLASQGHLVEGLLCKRRNAEVDFNAAPKGSIAKYTNVFRKSPEASHRWGESVKFSAEIDDLVLFASLIDASRDNAANRNALLRTVTKAVDSAVAERDRLVRAGKKVAEAAIVNKSGGEKCGDDVGGASFTKQAVALVVVDLVTTASTFEATALIAAAFIVARSQERRGYPRQTVFVNGSRGTSLVAIPYAAAEAESSKLADAVTEEHGWPAQQERACSTADGLDFEALLKLLEGDIGLGGAPLDVTSFERGAAALLEAHGQAIAADVMVLCGSFGAGREPALADAIARLKAGSLAMINEKAAYSAFNPTAPTYAATPSVVPLRTPLRALLVHRCRRESDIPFVPRRDLRGLTPSLSLCTVDLCIVIDCSKSMGKWMDVCKEHVRSILFGLWAETEILTVRTAFVAYRDFEDENRLMIADFSDDIFVEENVITFQQASGGGDEPEDVCGAMAAVCTLDWAGDIRIILHVADATAHGYCGSLEYCHDNHPNGTPDEKAPLAKVMARLRDPQAIGADLLFCQLSDRTIDLEKMYSSVYEGREGFGIFPKLPTSEEFKEVVLGAFGLVVKAVNTRRELKTFDRRTLSAVLATLNAGLKRSDQGASEALERSAAASPGAPTTAVATTVRVEANGAAEEGIGGRGQVVEDDDEADEDEDVEVEVEDEEAEEVEEDETGGVEDRGKNEKAVEGKGEEKGETTGARLMAELEGDNFMAVRIALKMPTAGNGELVVLSAHALLAMGVSADELDVQGYPAAIVKILRNISHEQLRKQRTSGGSIQLKNGLNRKDCGSCCHCNDCKGKS